MYKVIIADDEPWVVYNLVHGANWEAFGFTICDTAKNGKEALEKCISLQPDVLFSDIRMPGLSGLELLEEVRKVLPHIEVVLISGYAEFQYAQHAIRHGAADYLIKPVSPPQHLAVLKSLKERLEAKSNFHLNDTFFALFDRENPLSITQWTNNFSDFREYQYYRFLIFSESKTRGKNQIDYVCSEEFGQYELPTGRNKYAILLGYNSDDVYDKWMIDFKQKDTLYIGISNEESGNYSFSKLHRQGDIAFYTAMLKNDSSPLLYIKKGQYANTSQINEYTNLFEESLKSLDDSMSLRILQNFSSIAKEYMLDKIADIYNLLAVLLRHYRPLYTQALESYDYRDLAMEFTNVEAVFDYLGQSIKDHYNPDFSEPHIQNIIQYIDENYTKDLTLTELAARYHFSPSYFSTLFKKQAGNTLTKYITAKRIALAKILLDDGKVSIQDIVERIGYNDYFQFIKIFKREVGVTPGQYRNRNNP